ncbi:hypothetical protein ACLB2K_066618 [Fragaria x ananassa]
MKPFSFLLLDLKQGINIAVNVGMQYEVVEKAFRELIKIINGVGRQVKEPTKCFIRESFLVNMTCHDICVPSGAAQGEECFKVEMRVPGTLIFFHFEGFGLGWSLFHLYPWRERA